MATEELNETNQWKADQESTTLINDENPERNSGIDPDQGKI
jgi:hypothetical protein